jgi:hypothetical protein
MQDGDANVGFAASLPAPSPPAPPGLNATLQVMAGAGSQRACREQVSRAGESSARDRKE